MHRSTFAACLLLVARAAAAQSAAPSLPSMTLPQALAYAAEHQPSLLAARARLQAAQRETDIPRAYWQPRVGGTLQAIAGTTNNSTASYLGSSVLDVPRVGGTPAAPPDSWRPYPSTLAGVGLKQELFDSGRIGALETLYDAAARAEAARADVDRLDVQLLVEESFYGVFAARAVLQAAEAAEKRVQFHRDEARAGVRSGLRSPIELTRAEADLARFEVGRLRAAGGVTVAQAIFAAAVGVPDRLLDAAGAPVAANAPPSASAVDAATERAPEVRAARALAEQQQGVTRLAESALRPDVSLTAGITGRAGGAHPSSGEVPWGAGFVPDVPNWDVGLVLTWPIYDATFTAQAAASRERERQRRAEIDLAAQRVRSAAVVADEALRTATDALPALQQSSDAARANYEQANARFRAGLGSSVELADAEALRLQAEIDLAVGTFEQVRARLRLGRALAENL